MADFEEKQKKKLVQLKQTRGGWKETHWSTKKDAQISEKAFVFLLGWMCFTDNDGCQNLVFAPILSSLTLDNNKKVVHV